MENKYKEILSQIITPPHIIKCFLLKIQGFSTFISQ